MARYQHLVQGSAGTPLPGTLLPGEIAAHTVDRQIAVGDQETVTSGDALPLLTIRWFDSRASYSVGELVRYGNEIYRAVLPAGPGDIVPTQWKIAWESSKQKITVDQSAHGFVDPGDIGRPMYFDGGRWALAKGDAEATLATVILESVQDAGKLTVQQSGVVEVKFRSLVAGTFYFTDPVNAGEVTDVEPTGVDTISNPVFQALAITSALVLPWRAAKAADAAVTGLAATLERMTNLESEVAALRALVEGGSD